MEFITNPFLSSPSSLPLPSSELSSPSSPSQQSADDHTVVSTSEILSGGAGDHDTDSIDSQARENSEASAFNKLRTAVQLKDRGLSIERPSIKKGDWRAWGKCQAKVVVWNSRDALADDLDLRTRRVTEGVEKEWSLDGSVWLTKGNSLVFICDPSIPPEPVALSSPYLLKPTPGLNRLSRSLSRTLSIPTSINRKPKSTRTNSSSTAADEKDEKKGLVAFVKKLLKRKSSSEKDGVDEVKADAKFPESAALSLERTVTHVVDGADEDKPSRLKSLSWLHTDHNAERGRFPSKRKGTTLLQSPLPSCQGQTVLALVVPDIPNSIHNIRYNPQVASPPLSRVGSINTTHSRDGAKTRLAVEIPARVELDVGRKQLGTPGELLDEGQQRDVTIAFCFSDILLATEAEDLRQKLQELIK